MRTGYRVQGTGSTGGKDHFRDRAPRPRPLLSEGIASTEFDRFDRGHDDKPVEEITEMIVFGKIFDIRGELVGPVLDSLHGSVGILQRQAGGGNFFLVGLQEIEKVIGPPNEVLFVRCRYEARDAACRGQVPDRAGLCR